MSPAGSDVLAVTVVGGGVIGLTAALTLARRGHRVTVVTADPVEATTSSIAAAVWGPVYVEESDRVLAWSDVSRDVFLSLEHEAAAGIRRQRSLEYFRVRPEPDDWHVRAHGTSVELEREELPEPYRYGTTADSIRIDMGRYLPWLEASCVAAGVVLIRRRLAGLGDLDTAADVVVLAAGLASGTFNGDADLSPIRSQVLALENIAGLDHSIRDVDHPEGSMFVFSRGDTVLCGGFPEPGVWRPEYDPEEEARVLARTVRLVPALGGAPVVRRAVGHRPFRPKIRLDEELVDGVRVVTCYGHGGAGVTLSWGCAVDVADLVERRGGEQLGDGAPRLYVGQEAG